MGDGDDDLVGHTHAVDACSRQAQLRADLGPGPEDDGVAEVNKLHSEIERLKNVLKDSKNDLFVGKKGSKMAAERLSKLKSVSGGITSAADELSNIIKELEDVTDEGDIEMSEETIEKKVDDVKVVAEVATEKKTSEENSEEQVTKNTDLADIKSSIKEFVDFVSKKFETLEGELKEVSEVAKKAVDGVETIHKSRGPSRGKVSDETEKVVKSVRDESSFDGFFKGIL